MISINNVKKQYDDNVLFNHFNLEIKKNDIVCFLGPSGSGKTTLLNMIAGIVKPDEGEIISKSGIAYIFQETRLLPWATVKENLEFVVKSNGKSKDDNNIKIEECLFFVNLIEYQDYYPNKLSGGMKQRVAIARAFVSDADIILMDEPFKGLDLELKKDIMTQIKDIAKKDKKTILMVTHDESEALFLANVIYKLDGKPVMLQKWRDL